MSKKNKDKNSSFEKLSKKVAKEAEEGLENILESAEDLLGLNEEEEVLPAGFKELETAEPAAVEPEPEPEVEVVEPEPEVEEDTPREKELRKNALARVDLALLYPPFAEKLQLLAKNLAERGVQYWCIEGFRSHERQGELYAQGRTKKGKIVTRAKPGQSSHQYGVAADWCRDADMDRAGLQPDWKLEEYEILAEEATKIGLEAAFYWKGFREGPHVQLPLGSRGISTDDLISVYNQNGMPGVFHLLNRYQW